MKKSAAVLVLLLFPVAAGAHPGKTDIRGGHKCWKGCEGWVLRYGEYHLHDEHFRPIKLDRKGKPLVPVPEVNTLEPLPLIEPAAPLAVRPAPAAAPGTDSAPPPATAGVVASPSAPDERDVLPIWYASLAAALLFLLLLYFILRRRHGDRR